MKKCIVIKSFNEETGAISFKPTQYEYDTQTGNVSDTGQTYPFKNKINEQDFEIVSSGGGGGAKIGKMAQNIFQDESIAFSIDSNEYTATPATLQDAVQLELSALGYFAVVSKGVVNDRIQIFVCVERLNGVLPSIVIGGQLVVY